MRSASASGGRMLSLVIASLLACSTTIEALPSNTRRSGFLLPFTQGSRPSALQRPNDRRGMRFSRPTGPLPSQHLWATTSENVVIVGSGPAGYTAAIYCARANLKPLVFEGSSTMGGQLMSTTEVENFPGFPEGILGPDLMTKMRDQAARWGSELETDDVAEIDLKKRPFKIKGLAGREVEAHSIIIATGATAKKLGISNEESYWSKGITACAICDGAAPMFRNEPLAVVGGGDSAAEEAVYLTKYSPEVYLLVRSGQMRASKAMIDRVVQNPKIKVHFNTEIEGIIGDDPDKPFTKSPIKAIKLKTKDPNTPTELAVRGIFYAIGHQPNTELFKSYLDLDEVGYIKVTAGTPETSLPGVFAAGDVQDPHWRQAVTAAGTGCMAALAAERFLSEKGLLKEFHQQEQPRQEQPKAGSSELDEPEVHEEEAEGEVASPPASERKQPAGIDTAGPIDLEETFFKGETAYWQLFNQSPKPILVMFMSKTCGPCRILKPILSRVLKEYEGRLHYVEIDIEEYADLTLESGVGGTPTVQLYHKEELLTTMRGVKKSSEYKSEIDKCI